MRNKLAVAVALAAAVALPASALGGEQVPFKGADRGAWGIGAHDCGALVPVFVDDSGTGSHVGRYGYVSRECVDLATGAYAGTFTITAANGDRLVGTYAGTSTVDGGGNIHYQQTDSVTGGTGRFVGATGSFALNGLALADGGCSQAFSGAISRLGG